MTEYVYKLKNGKIVSAYADEKGNISITKEALEIMANSWNDGYQKGYSDGNLKGRADAEKEHEAMCETCIHKVSADDIKAIEDKARADAIDDYVKILVTEFDFVDTDIQRFIEIGESIK